MKKRGRPKIIPLPPMSKADKKCFINYLRSVLGLHIDVNLCNRNDRIDDSENISHESNRIIALFSTRLQEAIKKRLMFAPNQCSYCGVFAPLHAHHEDYLTSPLKVVWLCPTCHHQIHGGHRGTKSLKRIKDKIFPVKPDGIWEAPESFEAYYPVLGIRNVANTLLGSHCLGISKEKE